jgi:transposase InsO family protein
MSIRNLKSKGDIIVGEYLTISEFGKYSGITPRTVWNWLREAKIIAVKLKAENGYRRNHPEIRIHYTQLMSQEAQERFVADRGLTPGKEKEQSESETLDFRPWQKEKANHREKIVKEYHSVRADIEQRKVAKFKRDFARKYRISLRTLNRILKAYDEGGHHALIPKGNASETGILNDREKLKAIEKIYLVPLGPSKLDAYQQLCKLFGRFISYTRFVEIINLNWTPSQQLLVRNKDEWDRKYSPYARRDWNKVAVNEVWFGDGKQIDVACLFRGRPIFPWLTAFFDARSRKFVGWILTPTPDSWAIAQAFVYAVRSHGIPGTIYIDRGKSYKSYMIAGGRLKTGKETGLFGNIEQTTIPGIFRDLGSEIFFATGYNAKEKIIEPAFKIFTLRLRHLPGYRGHSTKTRPKKLEQEIRSGKLLSFDELEKEVDRIISERNARPHSMTGKVPDSFYDDLQPVIPSERVLAFLLMDVHQCRVGDSTVTIKGLTYRSEELWRLAGETVEVRRDPRDIRRAAVIYRGKLFGFANLEALDHYRSAVTLESVKTTARIRRRITKWRQAVIDHEDVIGDPLKFAIELDEQEKLRQREIRPAPRKVTSLHQKERLATDVIRGLENRESEEEAAAATGSIQARSGRGSSSKPGPRKRHLIPLEELGIWQYLRERDNTNE